MEITSAAIDLIIFFIGFVLGYVVCRHNWYELTKQVVGKEKADEIYGNIDSTRKN
jgi:hypothetical protein